MSSAKQDSRSFLRNAPIRQKLVILCMLTSTVSLLLASIIFIGYDHFSFRSTIQQELKVLAQVISNRSAAAVLFDDRELAIANLSALNNRDTVRSACVFQSQGDASGVGGAQLMAEYYKDSEAPQNQCPPPEQLATMEMKTAIIGDKHIDVLQPIELDGTVIGYLYVRSSLDELNEQLLRQSLVAIIALLFAASVALLLATRLEPIISAPLYRLGQVARQIAFNDDYSLRASKEGDDEIGEVVDSFNQMLNVIEHEDASLRASEERFRLFTTASNVGVFQTDSEGNSIFANERLCSIFDVSESEFLESNWLRNIHNKDRHRVNTLWEHILSTGEHVQFNCRLESSADKPVWVDAHIQKLPHIHGESFGLLGTVSDITEIKTAQNQLEKMAFYDTLTGLANRRLFRNRLENIIASNTRTGSIVALMLLDLDQFKHINDTQGHDAGDALLVALGERLSSCVRSTDTVARLGGDEFAVILVDVKDTAMIPNIAENILQTLRRTLTIGTTEINISSSIGIALAPEDGNSAEKLFKFADMALYRAKDKGRNNYQFYTEDLNRRLLDHVRMVKDLKIAIEKQEFELHYQPQLDIQTEEIIGFEALIRWIKSDRGFVSPAEFIPVAEETALILPIGRQVMEMACKQMRQMLDEKLVSDSTRMTVNLSVKQLIEDSIVEEVSTVLEETGLPAENLELEITESLLMENVEQVLSNLNSLKLLGVSLSIDDFGTGYSSLSYLKRLPVHIVKVDQSFVRDIPKDPDDMAITAAVIAMAHKLGYQVIAEGVETVEQLSFLRDCRCDYAQGYYFSKPLPAPQAVQFCVGHRDSASSA